MTLLQSGIAKPSSGYDIDQSLRFSDGYLRKSFSSGTNPDKVTISCWVKPANLGATATTLFYGYTDASNYEKVVWNATGSLYWNRRVSGSVSFEAYTSMVFRDPSSWYHLVLVYDSTDVTTSSRIKFYVNGVLQTKSVDSPTPPTNLDSLLLSASCTVGEDQSSSNPFKSYMAECHAIDGQALTPASFGKTNSATNQWVPIEVTGMTYGTNGFYQKYSSTELANSFTDSATYDNVAFTSVGSHTWTCPAGVTQAEILVVGGGGGGGQRMGGGGGAGGVVHHSTYTTVPGVVYDLTVGDGGSGGGGGGSGGVGSVGADSSFNNNDEGSQSKMTAIGGGGGGKYSSGSASAGGSGGGGTFSATGAGSGNQGNSGGGTGYGNNGGDGGSGTSFASGSGGGAGAAGGQGGSGDGPAGGVGREFSSFSSYGDSGFFAGGGGGCGHGTSNSSGAGGNGGGGAGVVNGTATSGSANTGGGGGGVRNTGDSAGYSGGAGGSGVVLLKFNISAPGRHTITSYGDVTNTRAQEKIGDSSIKFDGTGDYLTAPSSDDWDFGTGEFTLEMWIRFANKKTGAGAAGANALLANHNSPNGWQWIWRGSDNTFELWATDQSEYASSFTLNNDTWYHVAVTRDDNTLRHYVDGVQCGSNAFTETMSDTSTTLQIGAYDASGLGVIDGYMDEIRISDTCRYPDGTTFTPSTTAFTADANTKLLIHSDFNGGLGADSSGNKNDFTPTNLVATDQVLDSPTNNFCTFNPLNGDSDIVGVLAEGNLRVGDGAGSGASGYNLFSTFAVSSGKWYYEYRDTSPATRNSGVGWVDVNMPRDGSGSGALNVTGSVWHSSTAYRYGMTTAEGSMGATLDTNVIAGVALDADAGKIWFSHNGTWFDSQDPANGTNPKSTASSNPDTWMPMFQDGNDGSGTINYGQDSSFANAVTAQGNQDGNGYGDFYYPVPSGFNCLCSENLDDPAIALPTAHFNATLWTGDTSTYSDTRAITGVGHAPDFVWLKNRDFGSSHDLFDSVRGGNENLHSNTAAAETTNIDGGWINSFDSDGFTLKIGGGGVTEWYDNKSGDKIVGWSWKGGGTASSNGNGDIPSSVSANTAAGFSIVSYAGSGSAGDTVGHGLSQTPDLIIIKNRSAITNWVVNSPIIDSGFTKWAMKLDIDQAISTDSTIWNNTPPTSSVFTLGTAGESNRNNPDNYIAYCFHSVEGYSKVGSYTGNANADGPFIYTGFRPAFLLWKNTTGFSWGMTDNKRAGYNPKDYQLYANASDAEATSYHMVNFLSNGIKVTSADGTLNGSGHNIIFMAFAESPFKTSNAR